MFESLPREFRQDRPKRPGKKRLDLWLRALRDALRMANFKNADFDNFGKRIPFNKGESTTDYVRRVTKMYRDTWVTLAIQNVLADIEQYLKDME